MTTLLFLSINANKEAQLNEPFINIEKVLVEYQGKIVKAKKLTVRSKITIDLKTAWSNVKTPALLQFVVKGMIQFKAIDGTLPKQWEIGHTYGVKMRIFGIIPFGGIHHLRIEKIDDDNYEIVTNEWDERAKIWNHTVKINDIGNGIIEYMDSIIIYGGMLTDFITSFAMIFYKHRQKRWQIVAKQNLTFGD